MAQFTHTLHKSQATQLLRILKKIKAETRAEKKDRLKSEAEVKANGGDAKKKAPAVVKFGLNHVVSLVEEQQAKLVVIAHDVDPIELVKIVWSVNMIWVVKESTLKWQWWWFFGSFSVDLLRNA